MIDAPRRALDGSRIKGLGGKVFSRIHTPPQKHDGKVYGAEIEADDLCTGIIIGS